MSKSKTYADATMNQTAPRRLADLVPAGEGYTSLAQVEGVELEIWAIERVEAPWGGDGVQIKAIDRAERTEHTITTSSTALMPKLLAVAEHAEEGGYPLLATFRRINIKGGKTCWVVE